MWVALGSARCAKETSTFPCCSTSPAGAAARCVCARHCCCGSRGGPARRACSSIARSAAECLRRVEHRAREMAPRPRHRAVAQRPAAGHRRVAGVRQVIVHWPSGYDVERYAEEHGLDFEDITRDIVRIAAAAHLLDTGALDEDFVLTGGMALRLRGSNRFTIKDTDSSLRGRLDELELPASCDSRQTSCRSTPSPAPTGAARRRSLSTSSRSTTRPTSRRSPATQSRASSPSQSVNVASSNRPSGSRCAIHTPHSSSSPAASRCRSWISLSKRPRRSSAGPPAA